MGTEERLLLRLAMGVAVLVMGLAAAATGNYSRGRPIWLAVPLGIFVIAVVYGRLIQRRGGRPPGSAVIEAVTDRARRLGHASRRAVARLRGRRRQARVRQVEQAALEAAESREQLAPEGVRRSAESLFRLVQVARDEHDPARLAGLMDAELLADWEERLADAPRGERVEVVGDVEVEYVGFADRGPDEACRAVVLIEAELQVDGVLQPVCEFWTLGLRDGLWTLLGIEGRREGSHHLREPIGAP